MWMPLPPLSEQELITKYIESETTPFDTAIARTEREIALMQEYRTRLTADIVTGKLDVREAAAKLPEVQSDASDRADSSDALDESPKEEEP
jgi:type I restriction enzyme S subunit